MSDCDSFKGKEFSEQEEQVLKNFVSNVEGSVFLLKNLPEVIKGALFSRYSRSSLGLKKLLLKEFVEKSEETGFDAIVYGTEASNHRLLAIKKAQSFYDRILDGYGDDSIGELGGAHLAVEEISMLAAKAIEDCRIGGSPLEKSTRYICFDQKNAKGEYKFYKEPVLMTSAYRDLYLNTCNYLFETYSKLLAPTTALIEKIFPKTAALSPTAYGFALRAKVLDCLRGILPASALTNMGVFGNGRFFDALLQKLHSGNLTELKDLGSVVYQELEKEIPSFIRRAEPGHKNQKSFAEQKEKVEKALRKKALVEPSSFLGASMRPEVKLLHADPHSVIQVAAALLFTYSSLPLSHLEEYVAGLGKEEINNILESTCVYRENRRHKSPRALERANFTFEITADFGIYRDLQRHRLLTQERQLLNCNLGYYIPEEIMGTELEEEYHQAMLKAKEAFDQIALEIPEEAQYVVPMAYQVRWYFHANLRSLQWMCELRSSPAGHAMYRFVAQQMASQVSKAIPEFERFFKFVDFSSSFLGRLDQEVKAENKKNSILGEVYATN